MDQWTLNNGTLNHADRALLQGVGPEVGMEADALGNGVFLTVVLPNGGTSQRVHVTLGALPALDRFTATNLGYGEPFWRRPKDTSLGEPYWMVPHAGTTLSLVQPQTQWLLARRTDGLYLMLVPLDNESMVFQLEGAADDTLKLLGETNDAFTLSAGGLALFAMTGMDPYDLIARGAQSVAKRMGAKLRIQKKMPAFADHFGWCTWDTFGADISHDNVRKGLDSFASAGVKPRLLILDDGWLSSEPCKLGGRRLTSFEANAKFPGGLKVTVEMAKKEYGITDFLVWHAVCGYWSGIDKTAFAEFAPQEVILRGGRHLNVNWIMDWVGVSNGLVHPRKVRKFYDAFHAFLKAQGVDGVKVDNQGALQYMGDGQGGRVALFRAFRAAMEHSVKKQFNGALINCMGHPQENWYRLTTSNLMRTSMDYWSNPASHGQHLYANALVCLWFGEFTFGDWDMFQSEQAMGGFHAAGRAVSGGPVYVSDRTDGHDVAVLKKLVCSDGTVPRCLDPGRPTLDCLFSDVTQEPVLLKIFNRNACGSVVGVFNANYHANPSEKVTLRGTVRPSDVPATQGDEFVVYAQTTGRWARVKRTEGLALELDEGGYEVATVVPVVSGTAVIGLTNFFNASGAVRSVKRKEKMVTVDLRDGGDYRSVCATRPEMVRVDGTPAIFKYGEDGLLSVSVEGAGAHTVSWQC